MSTKPVLPEGFLDGPGPEVSIERIDFDKANIQEFKINYAVVLDNVLSAEECQTLISGAESTTNGKWERAMVNVGGGMQVMHVDVRNCGRIIWDDIEIAGKIWARVKDHVPEIHRLENTPSITGPGPVKRKEAWGVTRLNERMRFLKYGENEYFRSEQKTSRFS